MQVTRKSSEHVFNFHENPSKFLSQNHQQSSTNRSQDRGPEQTKKQMKKVTFQIAVGIIEFEPKVIQNGINK